jgi:aryl-alcohol dehydrogenase-like predicted oxidoreductase
MKTRKLGSQGPEISVIGYGAWGAGGMGWGQNPPDDVVIDAVRAGIDAGMTWVDTAEVYGGGRSEELMGEAVRGHDDVLVFTKLASEGAGSGYSSDGVRRGAEGSLKRLGRDVIDLYQIHWPSREAPIEETWTAMASLVDDGLVRYIGVSNFSRSLIEKCEAIRHVDSLQPEFSMLSQVGKDDLFPFCESNGTGIIAYGPLAYGILTGAFDRDTKFSDDDWRSGKHGIGYYEELFAPGVFEKHLDTVERLRPIAARLGISLPQLALAWVIHQRGVTGAIAGSRSPEHVKDNAQAGDIELAKEDLAEIDAALSP